MDRNITLLLVYVQVSGLLSMTQSTKNQMTETNSKHVDNIKLNLYYGGHLFMKILFYQFYDSQYRDSYYKDNPIS